MHSLTTNFTLLLSTLLRTILANSDSTTIPVGRGVYRGDREGLESGTVLPPKVWGRCTHAAREIYPLVRFKVAAYYKNMVNMGI